MNRAAEGNLVKGSTRIAQYVHSVSINLLICKCISSHLRICFVFCFLSSSFTSFIHFPFHVFLSFLSFYASTFYFLSASLYLRFFLPTSLYCLLFPPACLFYSTYHFLLPVTPFSLTLFSTYHPF